jgi:hypothetical protein
MTRATSSAKGTEMKLTIELSVGAAVLAMAVGLAGVYVAAQTYRFLTGPHG